MRTLVIFLITLLFPLDSVWGQDKKSVRDEDVWCLSEAGLKFRRFDPPQGSSGKHGLVFLLHGTNGYYQGLVEEFRTPCVAEDYVVIVQGMRGRTFFQPSPFFYSDTYFESAFLLLGRHFGSDWRVAGRAEIFSSDEMRPSSSINLSEHGHAFTAAVNWLPNDWLRLTGEVVHVVSTRRQRLNEGIAPHQAETQLQLSAKIYF